MMLMIGLPVWKNTPNYNPFHNLATDDEDKVEDQVTADDDVDAKDDALDDKVTKEAVHKGTEEITEVLINLDVLEITNVFVCGTADMIWDTTDDSRAADMDCAQKEVFSDWPKQLDFRDVNGEELLQGATLSDVPNLSPDLDGRRRGHGECVPGPSGGQDKVLKTRYSGFDPGGHEVLGDQRGGQHRGVLT